MGFGLLARLLTTACIAGYVLSQTSTEYVDSEIEFTGIVEVAHGVTYGFVLPQANATETSEFIGQVISPLDNKWVGVALGGANSLMVVAWPNETTIFGSPRYVDSNYLDIPYDGANISTIGTTVNETHWKWTYRCENCTVWPEGTLAVNGSQLMTWLVGFTEVETPDAENSTLSQYSDLGSWEQDLAAAQNANYSTFVDASSSLWTRNNMFPSNVGQSQFGPALAAHAGRLWAVGAINNNSLWYATGNNTNWDQSTTWVNSEVAREGPALAEFAGVLHLVFPDKVSGNLVHLQYNDTTAVWGQRLVTNFTSHGQPVLAAFNGSLALAYVDTLGSNRLHVAAWDPSVGWGPDNSVGELSWGTPSLYTVGTATQLYLMFAPNNNGRTILEITATAINGTWSRAERAICSNNGKGQVFVSFYNGSAWLPHENVASQMSSHTPAIAVLDGILNCIFPSHDSHSVFPFTQTQTMSITEQLAAGIRFFDLRCVLVDDTLQMYHGAVSLGTTLQFILQQISNFLLVGLSAGEALVVHIKQEGDSQGSSIMFDYAVYEVVQAQSQFWVTNATIPQLQQLRRKIQLVRRYPAVDNTTVGIDFRIGIDVTAWPDNVINGFTIPAPNGVLYVEDYYDYDGVVGFDSAVVSNKTAVLEGALAWCDERHGGDKLASLVFDDRGKSLSSLAFVVGVNRRLLTYINPMLLQPAPHPKVGTVLMDFPDYPNGGGLIAAIIELNG
ncbi:hypothetical protein DFH09DRAFT_1356022 [Mycena vulgaris]|nr:hypothetical protein DFH09DRAFT_1356022 [Mycena vulgaris]